MTSTVTVRMTGGVAYGIVLPTERAEMLARSIRRAWSGKSGTLDELHLADGTRVTVNPVHVVAVEVS